jgi:DNA-binding NarL/FixJ family response regulator
VTILLADEDALRRDGLSAVLSGAGNFEIVAGVPDGESALTEIRDTAPDVAVVDLNLPGLHGIELIRRVRSEDLRTKIVILASTSDDEIVREVIRAGGDGYLLKNGPARHLIDAISYVCDGGQYFSPQLRRDGLDRHLLEEPARTYAESGPDDDERAPEERRASGSRSSRPRRQARRASDPRVLRDRIREDVPAGADLNDHDYEIMSMMADGIRPILDRLDEIDNRVAQMEDGDEPVPTNPRGWLTNQLADSLTDQKGGGLSVSRTAGELEARLPEMIEEAVTRRFNQMANRLQEQIEETHVRTLETFVRNIQVKLVQRVSALEQDMSKQAEAMHQLREYSQRTEDNLSRLISGVDKLANELPRRLAAAQQESVVNPQKELPAFIPSPPMRVPAKPAVRAKVRNSKRGIRIFWWAAAGFAILCLVVWGGLKLASLVPNGSTATTGATPGDPGKPAPPPASADTKTKLLAAQQYSDRKDYPLAEDIYKQVIAAEPHNVEALKGLASVLYREDKVDESAAILDRIPKN